MRLQRKVDKYIWSVWKIVVSLHFEMSTQEMTKTIADYFATQPVTKVWLFGSYARGEQREDSDVDLLVVLDHSKPIGMKYFGMWSKLEELLGRSVDLVTEGSLIPAANESPTVIKY